MAGVKGGVPAVGSSRSGSEDFNYSNRKSKDGRTDRFSFTRGTLGCLQAPAPPKLPIAYAAT